MRSCRLAVFPREIVLIVLGGLFFHTLNWLHSPTRADPVEVGNRDLEKHQIQNPHQPELATASLRTLDVTTTTDPQPTQSPETPNTNVVALELAAELPETTVVTHAPGWTVFQNLYMSSGTLFIVSSRPRDHFPQIRFITSTGLAAENTPENIELREPSEKDMDFLSPEEAERRWGGDVAAGERNRVWEIEGNTVSYGDSSLYSVLNFFKFLVNDPAQFLRHYYHFVAELLLGAWAFWSGTFSRTPFPDPSLHTHYAAQAVNATPTFHRIIFANSNADGWRDSPGFNAYVLRAAFPSVTVEHIEDWNDRISATSDLASLNSVQGDTTLESGGGRAWLLPMVLFADRSAAFRGATCGSKTQRTASEAVEAMESLNRVSRGWWEPIRRAVVNFAGAVELAPVLADGNVIDLPMLEKVVITYISRQGSRRRLIAEDHDRLVEALQALVQRKNEEGGLQWELNIVRAETMSKDMQVRMAARTTVRCVNTCTCLRYLTSVRMSLMYRSYLACMATVSLILSSCLPPASRLSSRCSSLVGSRMTTSGPQEQSG
jgi:hypothetical protein